MNFSRKTSAIEISGAARRDITRIEDIWRNCLETSGGPFLFGDFTITDAMYAPVVNRFEKYELSENKHAAAYSEAIKALPPWQEWARDGAAEPWVCEIAEK